MSEGKKNDTGKDPWHLAPWDALREVVRVLAFGAGKYAPRNWEQGIAYSRCYSAALRHLTAWWGGEDSDPETGISHLAHAACCVLFLLAFELRGKKEHDDRPGRAPHSTSDEYCRHCGWRRGDHSANCDACPVRDASGDIIGFFSCQRFEARS